MRIHEGDVFGRWTVVCCDRVDKNGHMRWICRCECGVERAVVGSTMVTGRSLSCGCLQRERAMGAPVKHGMSGTPEYKAWQQALQRCENPHHRLYKHYGGRGITVCASWRESFTAFYEHIGPRPSPDHSLDRVDNDSGYRPGNVRWATTLEQNRNRQKRQPKPRPKPRPKATAPPRPTGQWRWRGKWRPWKDAEDE